MTLETQLDIRVAEEFREAILRYAAETVDVIVIGGDHELDHLVLQQAHDCHVRKGGHRPIERCFIQICHTNCRKPSISAEVGDTLCLCFCVEMCGNVCVS